MKYILNKTENPSKDALDKIENFAKFKLCKLWPDPPGWPDWSDKYSHRIEYERGGARTVKHVKLPVSMSQWVSYIRSSVQEMLAHLKMLITFERRVPLRSHPSQNDHKSSGYLSKTSAETFIYKMRIKVIGGEVKILKFGQNCVIWSKLNLVPVLTIFLKKNYRYLIKKRGAKFITF